MRALRSNLSPRVDRLTSSRPLHFFQADNSILLEKHIKSFGAPRVRFQSYSSSEHFDKLRSFLLPKSAEHGGGQWIGIAGDTRGAVVLYVPTSDAANSVWGLVWDSDSGGINQAINEFKRVLRKSAEQPEEWLQADGREQGL